MAINDEFKKASECKYDASGEYSSRSDASREFKREMAGKEESRTAIGDAFGDRVSSVEQSVGTRDITAGIQSAVHTTHGAADLADSAGPADDLDASDAAADVIEAPAGHSSVNVDFRSGGRKSAGKILAQNAALTAADIAFSDEESVVGQGWQTGRKAERVMRGVKNSGLKGGAAAAAGIALDSGDDENIVREAYDGARSTKAAYETGKAAKSFIHDKRIARKNAKALNQSAMSAKKRSMAIAKALKTGDAIEGMGLKARLIIMARNAASAAVATLVQLLGSLVGILASTTSMLAPLILIMVIVTTIFAGGGLAKKDAPQGLTPVESQVYEFFSGKKLDDMRIAAIMGNMYAESRGFPSNLQHVDGDDNACPNEEILALGQNAGGKAAGLWQWDMGRRYRLAEYAQSIGRNWYEVEVQLDYFWDHDVWHGNWGSGSNTKGAFFATDDLATAVRIFCRGWEVAGTEHLDVRVDKAKEYLEKFTASKNGQPLSSATDTQRAIVDWCKKTPSPGNGLCAMWVSRVFSNAGYPYPGGNANNMYDNWCSSSNRAELKVGMAIAIPRHEYTSLGRIYGHVGIYIGDGKVMHNIGTVETWDLDRWIDYYGRWSEVRWGWVSGLDLSA